MKHHLSAIKALFDSHDAASSLRGRTIRSGFWLSGGFAVQKGLQLISNLILTRLLFPEAFGLMALANVFLIGLAMFSDIGLKPAVIRDVRGDDPRFLNTAWTIQIIRGLLLCLVGAGIAYPVAQVYGQPILLPLLALMSTTAAISGFSSINMITSERRLDFRSITIVRLFGQLSLIILLIGFAFAWRSVWALAIANVVGSMVTVLLGHALLPRHKHRLLIDKESAKSLIRFGRWIFFSTLATFLAGEGLKAIQAGLISPSQFGVLVIAYTIAGIPNEFAIKLSASLGLPVLSETMRDAPENAHRILEALRIRTLALCVSLFAVIILFGEPIIRILYDHRYHDAGEYLVALTVANAISVIGLGYHAGILAAGKGSSYFCINIGNATLRWVGVMIGFKFGGIIGMIHGIAIANIFMHFVVYSIARSLGLSSIKIDILSISCVATLLAIQGNINDLIDFY